MSKDRNVNCTLEDDLQAEISRLRAELAICKKRIVEEPWITDGLIVVVKKEYFEKLQTELAKAIEDRDAYRKQAQSASRHALEVEAKYKDTANLVI